MRTREYIKAYQKAWREKNKVKRSEYAKVYGPKYYQENKVRLRTVRTRLRDNNLERYREKGRREYANNREKIKEKNKKRYYLNIEKIRARSAIMLALKSGEISRPSVCGICMLVKRIEAHHPDYTKPLEVIWVCSKCHKKLHK